MLAEYAGFLAGALIVVAWLPQLSRTWRTKSAKDISLWTLVILCAATALWLYYGLEIWNLPIIGTNALVIAIISALALMKLKYGGRN